MKHYATHAFLCWVIACCLMPVHAETESMPADDFSGYDAVILEATARFDHVFTFELSMETISYKIKYLTEKGIKDYGFSTIQYDPSNETIGKLEGTVTLPDGRTVKVAKSDIFKKDLIKKSRRKAAEMKVVFPSLEPGATVEFMYTRSYNGSRLISYWPFQSELYTVVSEVTFLPWPGTPCGYTMLNTTVEPDIKETRPGGNKAITVRRTNIPPLPGEKYALAYDSLREAINFYYVDSDSGHDDYWTKGVTRIFKHDLKQFMKPCSESRKIVSAEFQNQPKSSDEQIVALYNYVRNNFLSLDMLTKAEALNVDQNYRKKLLKADNASDLFQYKYVTAWQTNYILASLIKSAVPAAEVDLVLYLPWDEGTFDPYLKSIHQFTDRMLRVRCDGQTWWLAPGKRYMPPGMMDWGMKGVHVLFMNENGCSVEKIPLEKDTENPSSETVQVSFDLDNGTALVSSRSTLDRYESYDMRCSLLYLNEQERKDFLDTMIKKEYGDDAELLTFSLSNLDTVTEPLTMEIECKIPYEFEEAGDQLMMDYPGFDRPKTNAFLADTRISPVCFEYPFMATQDITYTFPDGVSIKSCPQNIRINQNIYVYKIDYRKISDNQLHLRAETNLQGNMLKKEAADFFRQTYNDILETNRKKLVLVQE